MGSDKEYIDFINLYKERKFHKSYSLKDCDLYSYSSNKGKFGISNLLIDVMIQDYSPIEIKLFLYIINTLKQSESFEESAIVYLSYPLYKNLCSNRVFFSSIKKYVKSGFLIATPKKKYYIVNPMYVNKFYKTKIPNK